MTWTKPLAAQVASEGAAATGLIVAREGASGGRNPVTGTNGTRS